jgi:hypothetical protein
MRALLQVLASQKQLEAKYKQAQTTSVSARRAVQQPGRLALPACPSDAAPAALALPMRRQRMLA